MNRPVAAHAIRLCRIGCGLTAALWFARNLWTAPRYLAHDGLLPLTLMEQIYWYAWQPLMRPDGPAWWPAALQIVGLVAALLLAAGRRPRISAGIAYAIAVCTYHRFFPLMYIDDSVLHLVLLWQILLPHPRRDETWVPGAAPRLALVNIGLIYLVAGGTKLLSPMWRDGTALWAILRHPLAWWPELMPAEPALHLLTWAALLVEPLMLLLFVLPPFHQAKWPILAGGLALHVGNVVLLDVAVANLACLALLPLVLHRELAPRTDPPAPARWAWGARIAASIVAMLVPAMLLAGFGGGWRTPSFERAPPAHSVTAEAGGPVQTVLYGGLWLVGLAQSYRLLDWIDERDAYLVERTLETDGPPVDVDRALGRSARETVVMSYLMGMTWTPLPDRERLMLRAGLARGVAGRACAAAPGTWRGHLRLAAGRSSRPAAPPARLDLRFGCRDGRVHDIDLKPERPAPMGAG